MKTRASSLVMLTLVMLLGLVPSANAGASVPFYLRPSSQTWLIKVVATTPTLADITNYVGGDDVYVTPLLRANQETTNPVIYGSMVAVTRNAKLLVRLGAGHDPWTQQLARTAKNGNLVQGASGDVDASAGIPELGGTTGYYWLDPENAKIIAANVLAGLSRVAPKHIARFTRNYQEFVQEVDENLPRWQERLAPYRGTKVITLCDNWSYFNKRFGFEQLATVAGQPGNAVAAIKGEQGRTLIIGETSSPTAPLEAIARQTGSKLAVLPVSVKARGGSKDYLGLIDAIVSTIDNTLK